MSNCFPHSTALRRWITKQGRSFEEYWHPRMVGGLPHARLCTCVRVETRTPLPASQIDGIGLDWLWLVVVDAHPSTVLPQLRAPAVCAEGASSVVSLPPHFTSLHFACHLTLPVAARDCQEKASDAVQSPSSPCPVPRLCTGLQARRNQNTPPPPFPRPTSQLARPSCSTTSSCSACPLRHPHGKRSPSSRTHDLTRP